MVDKRKLKAAIKENDGWWATIFSGRVANKFLAVICDWDFVSPNLLTTVSLLFGFIAAVSFYQGEWVSLIVGAFFVQLSFIFDCMDGQLARYRQEFSNFGAWYDRVSDRLKDFLYFFGLAWGYYDTHYKYEYFDIEPWMIWPLAMTAFFAVFMIDYYVNQDMKLEPKKKSSASSKKDSLLKSVLKKVLGFGLLVYQKVPILRFNIGEQVLLISVFAALNMVVPMLVTFSALGVFYIFYWPVAKLYGFTESKKD